MNMYEYISNVLNIGMMTAITGAIGWRRKQRGTQRGGSGGGSSGGGGSGINVTERGQRRQQRGRPRGPVAVLRFRAPAHDRPGHRADRVLVPVRAADGTSERLRPSGLHRSRWSHRRHRPPRCLRARLPVRRSESLPEPRHGQHRLLLLPGKSPSSVLLINYGAVPSTAPPLPLHCPPIAFPLPSTDAWVGNLTFNGRVGGHWLMDRFIRPEEDEIGLCIILLVCFRYLRISTRMDADIHIIFFFQNVGYIFLYFRVVSGFLCLLI